MSAVTQPRPPAPTAGLSGRTLPALLVERARTMPEGVALRKKELGRWKPYTWADYAHRTARVGAALRTLGVVPGDRVAILSDNRPAWVIADLAIQAIGGVSVGVYPTNPPAEVQYVLGHSDSVVLIAENEEQVDKALEVCDELPALRAIVVVDTRGVRLDQDRRLISWAQFEARGEGATVDTLAAEVAALDPGRPAIIVYTSGTTGPPKGAMLSHDNLLAAARAAFEVLPGGPSDEALSYLPLCHIAERMLSVVSALYAGYVVNFGEGGESFAADLREVQPTIFLGVPRVWEKLMAGVEIRVADAARIKRQAYQLGQQLGRAAARERMKGQLSPVARLQYLVGWIILFRPLRKKLGLLRVRQALSGAAPIAPQVLEWFWSLGVPVREAYGQTENTAQATITPAEDVRIGSVGVAYPGVDIALAADGELVTRGPGTFLGYFKDPDATRAVLDANGWLHTGDLGYIDPDGYVTITDRKKDIIITAGGKNISPSEIENKLKVSPFVREAVVIGDGRKYLVALIGIEADTVANWATMHGLSFTTYADLASKPEVAELIARWVERVNADLAQVETIKRFHLLPKELDQADGEVTATQKVKRRAIEREFSGLIEALYRGAPPPPAPPPTPPPPPPPAYAPGAGMAPPAAGPFEGKAAGR